MNHTLVSLRHSRATGRIPVVAAALTYLAVGVAYVEATPAWESPDELAHVKYVEALARGNLPDPDQNYEAHQPPLYYLWPALALKVLQVDEIPRSTRNPRFPFAVAHWFHPSDEPAVATLRVIRTFSSLLGVLVVILVWTTVRASGDGRGPAAAGAAFIVALLPQFAFISHAVSNDVLAAAVGALITYGLVLAVARPKDSAISAAIVAVGLGLAIFTKANVFAVVPAMAVVTMLVARRSTVGRYRPSLGTVALIGLPLALAVVVYFLLPSTAGSVAATTVDRLIVVRPELAHPKPLMRGAALLLWSFWARFGWFNLTFPPAIDAAAAFGAFLALLGVARHFRHGANATRRTTVVGMVIVVSMYGASLKNLVVEPQAQGRFLFPALAAGAWLLAVGWSSWFARPRRGRALAAVVGALLCANVYAVALLFPRAYASSRVDPPVVDTHVFSIPWAVAARLSGPSAPLRQSFAVRGPGLRRVEVPLAQVEGQGTLLMSLTSADGITLAPR